MVAVAVVAVMLGVDPRTVLNLLQSTGAGSGGTVVGEAVPIPPEQQELGEFVTVVLGYTEDVWHTLLAERGVAYREPTLVMFSGAAESACGFAEAAMGPFYCPTDQKVYIDLSFFEDLKNRHGAPGDFAQAYVIAHEIGHHVQNLLGDLQRLQAARGRASQEEYNQLSVRMELQADFYAGVWAHHAHQLSAILEPGDVEEALQAASSIGDDRLQRQGRGYVTPDSFTHGTSAQRERWFRRGLESGDVTQGDTFSARAL
jgi:predicted metalloprotease